MPQKGVPSFLRILSKQKHTQRNRLRNHRKQASHGPPRATVEVNDTTVEANGASVEANGESVEVNGESVEANGESVGVNGASVEVNGASVEANGGGGETFRDWGDKILAEGNGVDFLVRENYCRGGSFFDNYSYLCRQIFRAGCDSPPVVTVHDSLKPSD
jgi:hypothetical protein